MELHSQPAHKLRDMLQKKEISSVELTKSVLNRIAQVESKIGAFVTVTGDEALAMAEAADKMLASGENVSPLTGIPVAVKDNMCTKGILTTCSSKMLSNFVPPYDGTVVSKLRNAGTVFVGKANMDEFAMGSSTENSGIKKTANPWDIERIPGGSSGGSAAAVAADMCILATGSDTGGSIRQPAAHCGIVGIKPTYGLVSRFGLVAFASSLDQIGPMTKDVEDSALFLNAIAGYDKMDSTSAKVEIPDFTSFLNKDIKGLRIGLPKEFFAEGMDAEVRAAIDAAIKQMQSLGAEVVEVELPHSKYAVSVYYLCATAEASSNLGRYDGAHYGFRAEADNVIDMFSKTRSQGFGAEVKRRIILGTYSLSAGLYEDFYLKALKVRTLIKQDFEKAFEKCDVIAGATSPTAAFKFGEKTANVMEMYLSDIYTISTNLAGIPAISLPCGFTSNGLPIGLQMIAPGFEEGRLISAAHAYEQSQNWYKQKPVL